jgi:hypothetical protein
MPGAAASTITLTMARTILGRRMAFMDKEPKKLMTSR